MARPLLLTRARARSFAVLCGALVLSSGLPVAHAADSGNGGKADGKGDGGKPAAAGTDLREGEKVADVEHLQGEKAEVEKKIDKADKKSEETSAALQAANDALVEAQNELLQAREQLAQTRGELATAQALDALMQRRLKAAERRLHRAEKALADGEAEVSAQQDDLRAMVVASYEQGDPSLMGLSMVLTDQDPSRLAGNMNASSSVANKQSAILDSLQATEVVLAVHRAEMAAAKDEVELRRQEAADNLATKRALEMQAEAAESAVSDMVSLRTRARDAAAEARKKDMAVLKGLIVERERIASMLTSALTTAGSYSGPLNGNGFLDKPVAGYITSPYGWRIHPIYGYRNLHDGTDFGAACGTPIRAAAGGKVVTEYYQTAYGNRIVIDHGVHHGVGLATISNHLSMYAVAEGERVKRGDIIGFVGNTGWSTGCHLHFTVLENGEPVDPMKWF